MKVLHRKRTIKKRQPQTARKLTFQPITPLQTHYFVASVRYGRKVAKLSYIALIKVMSKYSHIPTTVYILFEGMIFPKQLSRGILILDNLKQIEAPSTRIQIFLNPKLFLSRYGFCPYAFSKFDKKSGHF